ncbi:MAG: magnesium/cobalt transporter CorA [Rhodospirillaceae bacterium]|nr:magnesium/cobalt transporter CorA [Rhodospirillaceae bacterium]
MLINCNAYRDGKKIADIPAGEIHSYLGQPGTFVWVALKDATPEELDQMKVEFGLHELAVEDARVGHQRPKIEEYGDCVFAVLHQIDAIDGELNVGEVAIFVGPNYILSVRNRTTQAFLGMRDRCEREPHLLKHGSGFVLYALMDAVVDRYFPVVDLLETELEQIEDSIFQKGNARINVERLYALKRKVMVLKHAVFPLLEAAGKLYGGRVPAVCLNTQEYFRDVFDHLTRINTSIDTVRDTIASAMQVNLSVATIEENEVTKRLAGWAGIFGVWTAFAGIWGMNFEFMPELKWYYGYPASLIFIGVVCMFLYWRFKKSGWL